MWTRCKKKKRGMKKGRWGRNRRGRKRKGERRGEEGEKEGARRKNRGRVLLESIPRPCCIQFK